MGEVAVAMEEDKREEETEKKEGSSEVVRWEKFLPRMVLRVLLVEADDSTRQIISALLRKCSYCVAAVNDGLMAWETLKDKPHNIDLILTEVELPSISGYALLTLVMEHDVCKNIPVIMMSSHDSISTVLKCMLKGAADFLIKPVRKNELRNLWQHVWRRQTLTAGNIPPNSSNAQHKLAAVSDNSSASDRSSDCATSSHKRKEYSGRGSDAQGSQPKCRSSSNLSNVEEKHEECSPSDKKSAIPESKGGERSTRLKPVDASGNEVNYPTALQLGDKNVFTDSNVQSESAKPENTERNGNISHVHSIEHIRSSCGAIDLIGSFDNGPKQMYGHMSINDGTSKLEFPSQLELSLRRFFPNSSKNQGVEESHALNHSNASAFSRYSKILQPLFPTSTANYTEFKDVTTKSPELLSDQISHNVNGVSQQHGANLNESQEIVTTLVIGQSGQNEVAYPNPRKPIPVPGIRLDNISKGYGHALSPLYNAKTELPSWSPKVASCQEQSPFPASTSAHSNPEVQDSERNRESVDTATNSVDQDVRKLNNMEAAEELKHGSPTTDQSTSSSMCNSIADHNNSSAYGSFSSRSDGNATFAGSCEKSKVLESSTNGGAVACDGFRGMDLSRSSQREAALMKFRMKRKDRCYEKKVRYQSRKRLAEMRPRVKGQFVRQVQNDVLENDTNG